jgi:hypothetical protein
MHHNANDLSGNVFGRLTVEKELPNRARGNIVWHCRCDCGQVIDVPAIRLRTGTTQSCGCLRRENGQKPKPTGMRSPHWNGGKHLDKDNGYVKIYVGPYEYQLEHILVMEKQLGRMLLPGEEVHHKNGIRHDNKPKNLELWSTSHPAGQRIDDKTQWAIEWLQQYRPDMLHG